MTFVGIPAGTAIFLDANVLIYHLTSHPQLGQACTDLVKQIEQGIIQGFTSTHLLSEISHRLMLIEASQKHGWPLPGTLSRLKKHPQHVGQLSSFRTALQQIPHSGIQVLTVDLPMIDAAAAVSQQTWLLSNDALIIALMRHHALTNLASHDAAFDRVPGITRWSPA